MDHENGALVLCSNHEMLSEVYMGMFCEICSDDYREIFMKQSVNIRYVGKRRLGRVFWRETPSFGAKLHLSTLYPQQATKRTTTRL